jgi:hypothetical protein
MRGLMTTIVRDLRSSRIFKCAGAIPYRRLRTTYRSHLLDPWNWDHSTMRNVPEGRISQYQHMLWNVPEERNSKTAPWRNPEISYLHIPVIYSSLPSHLLAHKQTKHAENCALIDYYAASSGNFLPTFRDNLSALSSGFKNPKSWAWYR